MIPLATIHIDKSIAHIGSIIRIDIQNDTFPTYKHTIVYVGGVSARITSHSEKSIYAIIPVGVDSGIHQVAVYDKSTAAISNYRSIDVIYENVMFEDTIPKVYNTNSRFAPTPQRTLSVYSRDLAYTNYTEVNDASSIIQNVLSIILTRKGERFFNPGVGTRVQDIIFSIIPDPDVVEKEILVEIKTQVEAYEPRAKIIAEASTVVFDQDRNALYVIVVVEVPGGSTRELGITISGTRKVNS